MKQILLLPFLLLTLPIFAQQPSNFLRPDVWLRADQIGQDSTTWEDKSKNGLDGITNNGFKLKTDGLINFNKAVFFDGDSNKLTIPLNFSDATQLTILTVYNSKGTLDERAIWATIISPLQEVMLSTQKVTGPTSIVMYSEGNMNFPVVNTSSQYWGKPGSKVADANLSLGGSPSSSLNFFSGEIAEFIAFERLVSGVELQILQSYLSLKYGATYQYSDYLSSKEDVIWSYADNEEYSYAIAGIGMDNNFDLYQKQSSNVEEPGILTIGAEQIATDNESNPATIVNGSFLIWGMNEADPTIELSDSVIYPYTMPILERKWKMQVTRKGQAIPTELRFDVKDIIGESTKCYLAIDRSGMGNFSSSKVEYIVTEDISENGIATFKNILWDEDKSGSDVFSLSFGMDNGVSCTHPMCHNDATGSIQLQIMGGFPPYTFAITSDSLNYNKEWGGESRFQNIDNLEPGNYRVIVTDKDGNLAQNTVVIKNPEQFSSGLEAEHTLNIGETLRLNAGKYISAREATFEWQSDNGYYSIDGEVILTQPGEYTLTITSKSGCKATEIISIKSGGDKHYNYSVYPNPSRGDYKLVIDLAMESPVSVRVYNVMGVLLSEETRYGSANYVFMNYIDKAGIYFVEIETDYSKETFKLIVNN